MSRKFETKHENATTQLLQDEGLSCPIPMDYVKLKDGSLHPVFRVESYLRIMSLHDKLPLLLGHTADLSLVKEFWNRVKCFDPGHKVFQEHAGREAQVIPCCLYCDEGRTLRKSTILVCNLQPVLGGNKEPTYDASEMHTNMKYSSWATRLLLFTMVKSTYKKNPESLYTTWESYAEELLRLWEHGVEVLFGRKKIRLYINVYAIKGDWPMLAKMGKLARFFGRKTRTRVQEAQGMCHLCLAGREGVPFHDFGDDAAWRATFLRHSPFKSNPPFACLPQHSAMLYRYDIFHCCHKGIHAELAGSGLVGHRCENV